MAVDCSELDRAIHDFIVDVAQEPNVKDLDDAVAELKKVNDMITRQVVVDAIVSATTQEAKETDEVKDKVAAVVREAKSNKRLQEQNKQLKQYLKDGTLPEPKIGKKQTTPIQLLMDIRDGLNKQLNATEEARKRRMDKREPKIIKKLKQDIAEREEAIRTGVYPEKLKKQQVNASNAVQSLRDTRKALDRELERTGSAQAFRLRKALAALEAKIKTGNIMPQKQISAPRTKEIERYEYQKQRLQNEIRFKIQQLKPKSFFEKAAEPFNAFRALMTTGEFSLFLRQGGAKLLSDPKSSLKAVPKMFKAFADEKTAYDVYNMIMNSSEAPMIAKAGIEIMEPTGQSKLSSMEELYMSHWIAKIPLVQNFQRSGLTFLNLLRYNSFVTMSRTLPVDSNGIASTAELKAIGDSINVWTGRGSLVGSERQAVAMNTLFFAPRYVASRFELLLGSPLLKSIARTGMRSEATKLIAQEYARLLVGVAVVQLLGVMAGGDLEKDPRSADFGKIRYGRTRLDVLFGVSQTATVLGRIAFGSSKTEKGLINPIRGTEVPFGGSDTWDVMTRFLRTKLSPLAGGVVDILTGEDVVGQPIEPEKYWTRLVFPLAYRDIYEVMLDQDIPPATAMSLLTMLGVGLQTYGKPLDTWTVPEINQEITKITYKRTDIRVSTGKAPGEEMGEQIIRIQGAPHKGMDEYFDILQAELDKREKGK